MKIIAVQSYALEQKLPAKEQFAFSLPDFPPALEPAPMYLEYDRTSNVFREKLATGIPEMQDGYIGLPSGDGLGAPLKIQHWTNHNYSITIQ